MPAAKAKKTATQDSRKDDKQGNPATKPQWPAITPSISSEDLSFEVLLPDQIITVRNLWTSSMCKTYVNFLKTLPMVTTPSTAKRGEAVRVNDRYQIDDAAFASQLWHQTALRDLIEHPSFGGQALNNHQKTSLWGGEVLGLNSNIRIYRYSEGQFFAQHYDESNNINFTTAQGRAIAAKTTWTLLLYLTSPVTGCEGGQTVFYPEATSKRQAQPQPIVAELEVGTALLHRHGADCLPHEGREVTAGEKWVIRSDLCVAR